MSKPLGMSVNRQDCRMLNRPVAIQPGEPSLVHHSPVKTDSTRWCWWQRWLAGVTTLWFLRSLVLILWEYRFYFPLDFQRGVFLLGRESVFHGVYLVAFYTHLVTAPLAFVLGSVLLVSGAWPKSMRRIMGARWHRRLGMWQWAIIVFGLAPSGWIMASESHAGGIAAAGLGSLALVTATAITVAAWAAICKRPAMHRYWATVTFLCLASPFFLRAVSGLLVFFDYDSIVTYRILCWVSWLGPWLSFQIILMIGSQATIETLTTDTVS